MIEIIVLANISPISAEMKRHIFALTALALIGNVFASKDLTNAAAQVRSNPAVRTFAFCAPPPPRSVDWAVVFCAPPPPSSSPHMV